MRSLLHVTTCLAFAVTAAALAPPSRADEPPPPTPDPAAGSGSESTRPPLPPREVQELPEVVVTAPGTLPPTQASTPLRIPQEIVRIPRAVNVVTRERVGERAPLSAVDALDDLVGVWVEKRTGHTSDLVIRGLSGMNLLALVDGNTLSTFWGEGGFAGDDMYGKIDPEWIERIEVVRGPSSVLYGSNALGGVVNFITRQSPFDFTERGTRFGSRTRLVGGTASEYWRAHEEVYGATSRLRWLLGGTVWESGNTTDGSGEEQDPTDGHGGYANAALSFRLSPDATLHLTTQLTDIPEAHRFYRPTQDNANYRLAIAATLELRRLRWAFADEARVKLYWQDKEDERRFNDASGNVLRTGFAEWETVQAGVQLDKTLGCHHLTYGADLQSTAGESPDDEQFTITPVGGTPSKAAPDSLWSSIGVYAQDVWTVTPRLTLTGSVRFDAFRFETDVDDQYVPPGGLDPRVDEFTDDETALVGGLQAAYALSPCATAFGGWTRGFRQYAPHFGVTQHGYGVVVPSRLLSPVTADQYELGLRWHGRRVRGEVVGYYTKFRNFQNIVRGEFLGQDWYDYDGDTVRGPGEDVYVTVGNGDAFVRGIEASAEVDLCALSRRIPEGWSLGGSFTYNHGDDETNDVPIRHTQPARGVVTLRYDRPGAERRLWVEAQAEFVARYDRIPPERLANDVGYLEDPQDPASGMRRTWGLPGYSVLDLRAGIDLGRHVTLCGGIENVLDKLYRTAHSRWDAPGRNFYLSVEVRF